MLHVVGSNTGDHNIFNFILDFGSLVFLRLKWFILIIVLGDDAWIT